MSDPMPVRYCQDENGDPYSPVTYACSIYNDDGTPMDIANETYVDNAINTNITQALSARYPIPEE